MRIPITSADWPKAFNKTAKYLGRHWPEKKLPLNASREVMAKLFGYQSTHNIQTELKNSDESIEKMETSLEEVISSLTLISLINYQIHPNRSRELFAKLPWRDLSIWKKTEESKLEKILYKGLDQENENNIFIMDEAHLLLGYKTPESVVHQYDQVLIPLFDYSVRKDGTIFRMSHFSTLIEELNITREALISLDINQGVDDFIKEKIIPLAWRSLDDDLDDEDYTRWGFNKPYMIEVEKKDKSEDINSILDVGKEWRVFHKGLNAYYEGTYEENTLKLLFKQIYQNNTSPLAQEKRIKSYTSMLAKPWIKDWWMPRCKNKLNIPEKLVEKSIQEDHCILDAWETASRNRSEQAIKRGGSNLISAAISPYFNDEKITINSLRELGEYFHEDELEDLEINGKELKKHHPELATYYDDIALGKAYEDYSIDNYLSCCCEHEPLFVADIFTEKLKAKFKVNCSNEEVLGSLILADLIKGKLAHENVEQAWKDGAKLINQHQRQSQPIKDMNEYALHLSNQDNEFVTHSPKAHITRKSSTEVIQDMLRAGRHINQKPHKITQTIEQINTESRPPLLLEHKK